MNLITAAPPTRSADQRDAALIKANYVRRRRAELKRDIKARRVSLHTVLTDPPEWLETAKVIDVLMAAPSYGRVRTVRILQSANASPVKTVGGLTDRQRNEIVRHLRAA